MRSGSNNFYYFRENKQIKLAKFVQFIGMLMFFSVGLGEAWAPCPPPLGYATV